MSITMLHLTHAYDSHAGRRRGNRCGAPPPRALSRHERGRQRARASRARPTGQVARAVPAEVPRPRSRPRLRQHRRHARDPRRAFEQLMLLDANLLLYAVHKRAEQHEAAASWLTEQLNGPRRVGLPWQSLASFLRIATHPRAFERPLPASVAWARVTDWLSAPV